MTVTDGNGPAGRVGRSRASGDAHATTTAARLLPTAAALFRKRGYAAATTRELSEALGIRKASLYHHITSKEDLLYAMCVESLRHIHAEVAAAAESASGEDRLRAIIRRHVRCALEDRDMHAVMLTELRNLSETRLTDVVEQRDAYESLIRDAIADDQAAGRLRTDEDAKYLTLALLNLLNWTIFWYDPAGDHSPSGLGSFLATMFLEGALKPRN